MTNQITTAESIRHLDLRDTAVAAARTGQPWEVLRGQNGEEMLIVDGYRFGIAAGGNAVWGDWHGDHGILDERNQDGNQIRVGRDCTEIVIEQAA